MFFFKKKKFTAEVYSRKKKKKKRKQNLQQELLASSTMVLSPLCPTHLNVRPSGTPPTQDHMLSPAAQENVRAPKEKQRKHGQN